MSEILLQFQIKEILSSSNPIAEIQLHKDEFFEFIDRYMVGCEHKNFHSEGDVWEHTKLVIQNIVAEEHDWIDVLVALLHDVGKKNALERNNSKNMQGHEIEGARIALEWLVKMDFDRKKREQVLWLIRNHMKALDLKVMRSKYDIWLLVKHSLFVRLRRLACADCKATLDAEGKPHDDFEEILNRPIVAECLENKMPVAIVEADDFASQKWDDIRVENALVFCHKMQINGGVLSKESLIRAAIKSIGGKNG
ncbi:MAG: HD domain-containing protein [Fibrobacter sp.]|nr:HD domain-containing protein [Fibrobacter sp.]